MSVSVEKELLISEVEKRPEIWEKSSLYRDRNVVESAWEDVSKACSVTKTDAKKAWKNLVDRFRGILNDLSRKKSGSSFADVETAMKMVKWAYFKQMMFLKDVMAPRISTHSNIPTEGAVPSSASSTETEMRTPVSEEEEWEKYQNKHDSPSNRARTNNIPSLIKSRPKKRKMGVQSDGEIRRINKELRQGDKISRFLGHLGDIIGEVPDHLQRKCMFELLSLANSYADDTRNETR